MPDRTADHARLPRKRGTNSSESSLPSHALPPVVDIYTSSIIPPPPAPPQSLPTASYLNGKRTAIDGPLPAPAQPLGQPRPQPTDGASSAMGGGVPRRVPAASGLGGGPTPNFGGGPNSALGGVGGAMASALFPHRCDLPRSRPSMAFHDLC